MVWSTLGVLCKFKEIKTWNYLAVYILLQRRYTLFLKPYKIFFFSDSFGLPSGVSLISRTDNIYNNVVKMSRHF